MASTMLNFQAEKLKRLPKRPDEVWQGGVADLDDLLGDPGGTSLSMRAILWMSVGPTPGGAPVMVPAAESTPERIWEALLYFAENEESGGYLPGKLEVDDPELAELLRERLAAVDVEVDLREQLPQLRNLFAALGSAMCNQFCREAPSPLSGRGVTIEHLRRFAEAAKLFYEVQPWRHLEDVDLVKVELPRAPRGMKYVSVLGAGGQVYGLAFYATPSECWDIAGIDDPGEAIFGRSGGIWSFTFDTIEKTSDVVFDLWERHDLPLACEDAYPSLVHFNEERRLKSATKTQLNFVEGLLRALAASTEAELDSGRWTVAVETQAGAVEYALALPDLLDPPTGATWGKRGFMMDRRAMESMMIQGERLLKERGIEDIDQAQETLNREFVGKPVKHGGYPGETPLERAQDLCFEAFDSRGRRQLQLAREALEMCPDCADAYVILAERCFDAVEALAWYLKGIKAGRRALGQEFFEEEEGHFWGIIETRPFMRACLGAAQCLEAIGRKREAVELYREMLRLNPNDNQGVRYEYLPLLLRIGLDKEAEAYLKEHDDPSPHFAYLRAMLAYRRDGDTPAARSKLAKAVQVSDEVIEFLLSDEDPWEDLPETYALGSSEHAKVCAAELQDIVIETPGALEWLERHGRPKPVPTRPKGKKRKKR